MILQFGRNIIFYILNVEKTIFYECKIVNLQYLRKYIKQIFCIFLLQLRF